MIVLEHTNPPTIYLDYHYWLPERGASGVMIGGNSVHQNNTVSGPFIMCNPTPTGEITLGSPITKNKSTFSVYHSIDTNAPTGNHHFGGSFENADWSVMNSQGIFHHYQDDNYYWHATGSRTN